MLSWSKKRQLFFIGVALFFLFVVLGIPFLLSLRNTPSCSNRVQDTGERGVDCGGSCRLLCPSDTIPPLVQFVRPVAVEQGLWGAVAYVENKNVAEARNVPYLFKLYDANNLLLYERHGSAYIPPRKVFAIFEGRMITGGRIPTRAIFEFESAPRFESAEEEPILEVRNKRFSTLEGVSRLEAELANPTLSSYGDIDVTALLFDEDGTVFAASATNIPSLVAKGRIPVFFTWPEIRKTPARFEILYVVSDSR